MNNVRWFVAHTRPRREKKLRQYCEREGIAATLPCYRVVHKYPRKAIAFEKPFFPGYVFLQIGGDEKRKILQSDHVANLLVVHDQDLFEKQLDGVLRVLSTDLRIFLMPRICPGADVRIRSGPLQGIEGRVTEVTGSTTVILRIDFIGQAAAVQLDAQEIEPL